MSRRALGRALLLAFAGWSAAAPPPNGVLIGRLDRLVLASDPKDFAPQDSADPQGLEVKGLPLLERAEIRKALQGRLGKPLTEAERAGIVSDILLFYRSRGRPFVEVLSPPNAVDGRTLRLVVLEAKLGAIRIAGARWFDASATVGRIRAAPGREIDLLRLKEDLDWINRNPFRQVDVVFVKGSELGTTDLELRQTDRFPLRVYGGYEDSGTRLTDLHRVLAGLNWGNVFGLDGGLDYQYMADPRFRFFKAHTLSYGQPLPWRHILTLTGSYATMRGDVPAPFDLSGYSWQASARYEVPLPRWESYREAIDAGFDFKRANTNLAFGGQSVYGTPVDTAQWSLGYNASLKDALGAATLRATAFFSPGAWTARNTDAAYESTRSGARARYAYGKVELGRTTRLPWDFSLVNLAAGQLSGGNLLAGEQLGFGGYDTVRGYDARIVVADQGAILNNELRTPPLSLLSLLRVKNHPPDKLQLLGFADFGCAANKHLLASEPRSIRLAGAGPGVRYSLASNLTVRADYGWRLIDVPSAGTDAGRWHVGAVLSY